MKKLHVILAGLVVLQLVLSVVLFWPRSAATAGGGPAFSGLKPEDVTAITVTDDTGASIRLAQVGGGWVLPDADGFPAKPDKVAAVILKIIGLETSRLVSRSDVNQRRLQVADDRFLRRLEFETATGEKHTVFLGSSPSYSVTNYRVDSKGETYLTSGFSIYDANATADAWIDSTYFSITEDEISAVTLQNGSGTMRFTKSAGGEWTMEGLNNSETADTQKIADLVRAATSIDILRPLGKASSPAYGLEKPQAVITYTTQAAAPTLKVGAQNPDDKSFVILVSESPYYVRAAEYAVGTFVTSNRSSFLAQPPQPTATPTKQ